MFRKKEGFRFKGRKHSRRGIGSVVIGSAVLLVFLLCVGLSGSQGGNGGAWLGIAGILLFFLSVAGFILGYAGFKESDIYYMAPIVGVVSNGLFMILFLSLYVIGFMSV